MWEFLLLAFLVAMGFGTAILMARKTKAPKVTLVQNQVQNIDLEELATKVARAVAKEVAEEVVKKLPKGYAATGTVEEMGIQMDESLIPIAIDTAVSEANLEGMAKEEKAVDKDLEKSKSKLAGILKRKKQEDNG